MKQDANPGCPMCGGRGVVTWWVWPITWTHGKLKDYPCSLCVDEVKVRDGRVEALK